MAFIGVASLEVQFFNVLIPKPAPLPTLLPVPGKAARSREMGRKVMSTLTPQICPLSLLLAISSCFQLLLVAPSLVSSFPASSVCPTAASGKSQPLSGATAAGGNWSLSSITGAAFRAGSLPMLSLLWLLYCAFIAKRPAASCPPKRGLQSQSQALSGYIPSGLRNC